MAMKEVLEVNEDVEFAKLVNTGDKVEGFLTEVKDSDRYGKVYTLDRGEDQRPLVLIGKMNLNSKMKQVPIGSRVSIELTEIVKTANNNSMKVFKVMFEETPEEPREDEKEADC